MKIEDWYAALNYSPEQLEVARRVLEEIRGGQDTSQAMRHAPLKDGGYVAKHMLVQSTGSWSKRRMAARPGAVEPHPYETDAHAFRRDHGDRFDRPVRLPRAVHFLPHRRAHAQELPAR